MVVWGTTAQKQKAGEMMRLLYLLVSNLMRYVLLISIGGVNRVFKFHRMYSDHRTFNTAVNKGLKQIADEHPSLSGLTSYYARHSWGTLARNVCGIHKEDIAMALNHVDSVNKVTDIYIKN